MVGKALQFMQRYILTGTPGCGKTALIRALEMTGCSVVSEAATDVIAYRQMQGEVAPWQHPNFIDDIVRLQKQRQLAMLGDTCSLQFYDRSPLCTYALAAYLGFEPSADLLQEITRIQENQIYAQRIFFIENLGFVQPTAARTISYEESLKFEKVHYDVYLKFGYDCVKIPAAPVADRVATLLRLI